MYLFNRVVKLNWISSRDLRNLANIIRYSVQQTPADVFRRKFLLLNTFLEYLAEGTGDRSRFEPQPVVILT